MEHKIESNAKSDAKNNVKNNVTGKTDNSRISKIKRFLSEDRGGTNFKEIYSKIPSDFYEKCGFIIVVMMVGLLLAEEIFRVFFDTPKIEIYIKFFYLVGAFGELFAVLYIGSFFYRQEKQSFKTIIKTHIWDLAFLMMLIWSVVSTCLAEYPDLALKGTLYRHDGLYTYLVYAGMYVCGRAVKSEKLRYYMLCAVGIMCTLLSCMSIPQTKMSLMHSWGRVGNNLFRYTLYSSIFYNTNHFGYFLVIGLLALAGLAFVEKKIIGKIIWLLMFGFNMWALIINDTFGSYLGVLSGIVFLSVIMIVNDKKRYKTAIAVITVFLAVSIGMDAYNHSLSANFGVTIKESQEMSTNDGGGSGRIGLWKQALKYVQEKPVFGFGPEGLAVRYYEDGFFNDRPHNEYLQHAVFLGIPSLVFYLTALISIFICCLKKIRGLSITMLVAGGIVFAYCVSAFFGNTMYYTTPYYFIFLGVISGCYLEGKAN